MKAILIPTAVACIVAGCATSVSDDEAQQQAEEAIRSSFTHGNREIAARVEKQDEVQALCSRYRNRPPKDVAEKIEKSEAAAIRYPTPGKFLGDWRQGEKIAQSGYGMRFTDHDTKQPNGGNCYACHRLAPQELSYGTVGPSLYRYGALRGSSEAMQRYTYGKIYNAEAFSACSSMPRFGPHGILT